MVVCLGQYHLMGRTVPTWRNRVEAELLSLDNYRRALNSVDRKALTRLINGVRNRRTAGACCSHDYGNRCYCRCCWNAITKSVNLRIWVKI